MSQDWKLLKRIQHLEKKSCYSGVRNKKNVCMLWQIWNSLTLQRAKPTSSVSLGETQYIVVIIISSRWCPSLFLSRDHQLLHRCSHSPPCVWRPGANEASPTVCFLASFVVMCNTSDELMKCWIFCLFHNWNKKHTSSILVFLEMNGCSKSDLNCVKLLINDMNYLNIMKI